MEKIQQETVDALIAEMHESLERLDRNKKELAGCLDRVLANLDYFVKKYAPKAEDGTNEKTK